MRRAVIAVICAAVAPACVIDDHRFTDPGIDPPPPPHGNLKVRLYSDGALLGDRPILINDADGALRSQATTSANGAALVDVEAGTTITVVDELGNFSSVFDAAPGDDLVFGTPIATHPDLSAHVKVSLPTPLPAAARFALGYSCYDGHDTHVDSPSTIGSPAQPVQFNVNIHCVAQTLEIVVVAYDAADKPVAYLWQPYALVEGDQELILPPWRTDIAETTFNLNHVPAGLDQVQTYVLCKALQVGAVSATPTAEVVMSYRSPPVREAGGYGAFARFEDNAMSSVVHLGETAPASITMNLEDELLPHIVYGPVDAEDPRRPHATWSTDRAADQADLMYLGLGWRHPDTEEEHGWTVRLDPAAREATFPEVPETIDSAPGPATVLYDSYAVELLGFSHIDGYDQARSNIGPPASGPYTTSYAIGGS